MLITLSFGINLYLQRSISQLSCLNNKYISKNNEVLNENYIQQNHGESKIFEIIRDHLMMIIYILCTQYTVNFTR